MSAIKPNEEVEKIVEMFRGEIKFEDQVIQHLNDNGYTLLKFLKMCAEFKALGFLDDRMKVFANLKWTSAHEKILTDLKLDSDLETKIRAIFDTDTKSDSPISSMIKSFLQEATFVKDKDEDKKESEYLIRDTGTSVYFPSTILFRECYRLLIGKIEEKLEINLTKPDVESVLDPEIARANQILVTGSPGIGKTLFGHVLIKILYDHKIPFIYHTSEFKVLVADGQVTEITSELPEKYKSETAVVYVVDNQKPDMAISIGYASSIVYIFHPKRANRDVFTKNVDKKVKIHDYYLHLWDYDEATLPRLLKLTGLDADTVTERIEKVGPIARPVFADNQTFDRYWSEAQALANNPNALTGCGRDELDIGEPYHKLWHIICFDLEYNKCRITSHILEKIVLGRIGMGGFGMGGRGRGMGFGMGGFGAFFGPPRF